MDGVGGDDLLLSVDRQVVMLSISNLESVTGLERQDSESERLAVDELVCARVSNPICSTFIFLACLFTNHEASESLGSA